MRKKILSIITLFLVLSLPMTSFAHSGRTDSSGGHRDNKNKSGLGSYHYHCGGNPPHLHSGGVCPYSGTPKSSSSASKSSATPKPKTVYASKVQAVNIPTSVNSGESVRLSGKAYPSNAVDSSISWSSETPDIATISSDGQLKAIGVGTAVIVAKTGNGASSRFRIKITEITANSIEIQNKIDSLTLEATHKLNVVFNPENTTYKDIIWSSSDESVVTISDSGMISATGLGTATITATHKDLQDFFQIEILPIKAESITISVSESLEEVNSEKTYTIKKNEAASLVATVLPKNTTDKTVKWSVDDENIASIDNNGEFIALASGTVTVTAETENGIIDTITIEIPSTPYILISICTLLGISLVGSLTYLIIKRKKMTD